MPDENACMPAQRANAPRFHVDVSRGNGGSLAIIDDKGRSVSVVVTEEAMANQSRDFLKPIVNGLMYPGSVGLLVAPPKVGKSNFEFMLAHELAFGRDYLGYEVQEPSCVLIAEIEEGDTVMCARYSRFPDDEPLHENGECSIQHAPGPFNFIVDSAGAVHVDVEKGLGLQILAWREGISKGLFPERPGVVFIDTLARALPTLGGGKYSADLNYIGAVHQLAEQLKIAIVFVHHANKGDHADAADSISGTNGIAGSCDWTMILFRDTDPRTKKRVETGRLVCNSRFMSEDDLFRWVKLSKSGFWELDEEKETAERVKERTRRERQTPGCVRKIGTLMRHHDMWDGSAADLLAAIGDAETKPQVLARKINQNQEWLSEQGISYWNDRKNRVRLLHFRRADM